MCDKILEPPAKSVNLDGCKVANWAIHKKGFWSYKGGISNTKFMNDPSAFLIDTFVNNYLFSFQVPEIKPNGVTPQPRTRKVTPANKKSKAGLNNNNGTAKAAPTAKQSEAAKARDEARKKMIEDKKRLMRERLQQQQDPESDQVVEMFLPA